MDLKLKINDHNQLLARFPHIL